MLLKMNKLQGTSHQQRQQNNTWRRGHAGQTESNLFLQTCPRTRPSKERRLRAVSHTLNHLSLWVIPHLGRSALFACDVTPSSTARPLRRKIRKGVARETETGLCFVAVTSVWSAPGISQSRSDESGGGCGLLGGCEAAIFGVPAVALLSRVQQSQNVHIPSVEGGCVCVREIHFGGEQRELLLSCRRRHDVYQDGFGEMYPESSHHPPFTIWDRWQRLFT